MTKDLVFKSIGKFERHYFPEACEKENMEKIMQNPGKFGKHLARELMNDIRKSIGLKIRNYKD